MNTTTRPATVAACILAALYLLSAAGLVYLVAMVRERVPVPPEAESSLARFVLVSGVFAGLWAWSAVACARRRPSPIILAAIVLTAVQLVRSGLGETIWAAELDPLEIGRTIFHAVLVAVVIAWRPRGIVRAASRG